MIARRHREVAREIRKMKASVKLKLYHDGLYPQVIKRYSPSF